MAQLSDFIDPINRGFYAGTLGVPVDLANLLANLARAGVGYIGGKTGLLPPDQLPELVEKPVGGSEWIGERMRQAGLLSGARSAPLEMVGGLLTPLAQATRAPVAGLLSGLSQRSQMTEKASTLASNNAKIRRPVRMPERPFNYDYPRLGTEGALGQPLAVDIDGRPLGAQHVAGRRTVGGPDVGLVASDIDDVLSRLGIPVEFVPGSDLNAGALASLRRAGGGVSVKVRQGSAGDELDLLKRHELGHAINDLAGQASSANRKGFFSIPEEGIKRPLASSFDELNNWQGPTPAGKDLRPPKKQVTPEAAPFRYAPDDASHERWAEAIRWYLTEPGSFKTLFPEVAAAVRKYVNQNSILKDVIQFNSLALPGYVGLGVAEREQQAAP